MAVFVDRQRRGGRRGLSAETGRRCACGRLEKARLSREGVQKFQQGRWWRLPTSRDCDCPPTWLTAVFDQRREAAGRLPTNRD